MAVSFNQLIPGNLRSCFTTGANLNASLVTSNYTGGTPTNANQLKRSIVDAAGNVKKSLTNSDDTNLHATVLIAK